MKKIRTLLMTLMLLSMGGSLASAAPMREDTGSSAHLFPKAEKVHKLTGTSTVIQMNDLKELKASSGWKVILTQGDQVSVRLEYSEKAAPHLLVKTKGDKLYLLRKTHFNVFSKGKGGKHIAYITVRDLRDIDLSGASTLEARNKIISQGEVEIDLSGASSITGLTLEATSLSVDASGASDADITFSGDGEMDLDASGASNINIRGTATLRKLSADASGASDIKISGSSVKCSLDASGSSDIDASKHKTTRCALDASGASTIKIRVEGNVDAEASGSSDIFVYGTPQFGIKKSSGSSDIKVRP